MAPLKFRPGSGGIKVPATKVAGKDQKKELRPDEVS
jgi:hypothetical protein